jgi:hypothetical protein
MVRVIYEQPGEWPDDGPLVVQAQFNGEIPVSPGMACRRASGYLAREVALFLTAGEPTLVLGEPPCWRIPAVLRLRGVGELAAVGVIDVDARTSQVIPLTDKTLQAMRTRANKIASLLPNLSLAAPRAGWEEQFRAMNERHYDARV